MIFRGGRQAENARQSRSKASKKREGTTSPPKAHVPPDPETTHISLHTEPPQQPTDEPQQQLTQPNTTTTDTQFLTPCDTDENMTEENPAALQGRRFDPHREPTIQKPARWNEMSKTQRRHWLRHRLQTK